ncbi:MAG TPA: methylated-DNA--[protein]-cysteine S-methyltransferase [Thermomicrobiales bacterium]|nr:methylated-DNA--[protein]-cysteine S-methyltransferase [Thermomicrobiales bacterium]
MNAYLETVDSPAGPLTFAVNEDGALLFLSFLEGHYPTTIEEDLINEGYTCLSDPERTAHVRQQLVEYASGERTTFDLPVVLQGTEWQKAVWRELMQVPFGETRTYGELARSLGRPQASRAVGRANGTNRIPLVIPCHRIIGADGTLTGFGGGLHLKTALLTHEGVEIAKPAKQLALAT